jgi:hypothetical protein
LCDKEPGWIEQNPEYHQIGYRLSDDDVTGDKNEMAMACDG